MLPELIRMQQPKLSSYAPSPERIHELTKETLKKFSTELDLISEQAGNLRRIAYHFFINNCSSKHKPCVVVA